MASVGVPVWIRVLGATEVLVDRMSAHVGGPRQRALLALLVLRRNQPVAAGDIAETIWSEPALTSENTVQVYVSRLRRTLGAAGAAIESVPGGYRLNLADEELDAARFTRLAHDGHRLLASGDVGAARSVLEEALALWQGEPFADLRYEAFVRAERDRLEGIRRGVRLDLTRSLLAGGDGAAALSVIEGVLTAAPLDEGAHALLMRTLYTVGRQADALAAYHDIRQRLDEDLGIEPGAELDELQRLILNRDPSLLRVQGDREDSTAPLAAAAVPAPLAPIVGRVAELQRLTGLFADHRLVTLTGPGGVGKTRLALETARALGERFPGGVGFIDLSAIRDAALVPAAMRDALALDVPPEVEPAEAVVQALRTTRALLVLDNFEQVAPAAAFVKRLLGASRDLHLLVTSRAALGISGEREIALEPLSAPSPLVSDAVRIGASDAVRMFMDVVQRQGGPSLTDATATTVAEVCRRLDGLPLALELVASQARTMSFADIKGRLGTRIDLQGEGADVPSRQQTLRAAISWSADLMSANARDLLARTSVFVGGFNRKAAEAVAEPGSPTHQGLTELVRHSLVAFDGELDRFRMLDTIREYGQDSLAAMHAVEVTREREAEWLAQLIADSEAAFSSGRDRAAALDRADAERSNIRDALAWAVSTGHAALALRLASGKNFWAVRGGVLEGVGWLKRLLALPAQYEPQSLARAHSALGGLSLNVGDFGMARAEFEAALPLWEAEGELRRMAVIHNNLGIVAERLDELDECRTQTEAALQIMRHLDDRVGIAATLGNLGVLAERLDDLDGSIRYNTEALAIARELDDPLTISIATGNLGGAALKRGNVDAATTFVREALQHSMRLNDIEGIVVCCELSALIASRIGHHARAAMLLAGSGKLREQSGFVPVPEQARENEQARSAAAAALGETDLATALARGAALTQDQLVALALADEPAD